MVTMGAIAMAESGRNAYAGPLVRRRVDPATSWRNFVSCRSAALYSPCAQELLCTRAVGGVLTKK